MTRWPASSYVQGHGDPTLSTFPFEICTLLPTIFKQFFYAKTVDIAKTNKTVGNKPIRLNVKIYLSNEYGYNEILSITSKIHLIIEQMFSYNEQVVIFLFN